MGFMVQGGSTAYGRAREKQVVGGVENDTDWEARIGRENYGATLSGVNSGRKGNEVAVRSDYRDAISGSNFENKDEGGRGIILVGNGPINQGCMINGPDNEEDIGLNLEDRKRRRSWPITSGPMDTDGGFK